MKSIVVVFDMIRGEIVDLASTDLVRKTKELKAILNKIKDIVNS